MIERHRIIRPITLTETLQFQDKVIAGLGEFITHRDGCLSCMGLGSCVALMLTSNKSTVGVLGHIVLPVGEEEESTPTPAKFANIAIPKMIAALKKNGIKQSSIQAILLGGAHLFRSSIPNETLRIGDRNVQAVRMLLSDNKIPIIFEDVGGGRGRSFTYDLSSNLLQIRYPGEPPLHYSLAPFVIRKAA